MRVVIDANIALALVVPVPYSPGAAQRFGAWKEADAEILAPALWEYEVVSGLRKAIVVGALTAEEATAGLQMILALNVETVAPTLAHHLRSLSWAERLGQRVAYDASYMALAEEAHAEFWTADEGLVNGAQRIGATWVHWIGEARTADEQR